MWADEGAKTLRQMREKQILRPAYPSDKDLSPGTPMDARALRMTPPCEELQRTAD